MSVVPADQAPGSAGTPRVIVVGGGLAGMAAAVALEAAGVDVMLLEATRHLGGRAGSFEDPKSGEELDNCQHVLLGCCTNLIDFYRRLGVSELIRFESTLHFLDGHGHGYELRGTKRLPAPFHLASSMARFAALTPLERVAISRAMLAMMRLGGGGRLGLADISFGQWLDENAQPEGAVRKLYDPILTGALNENCRDVSASYAIQVFQAALLANSTGYLIGLPDCPLGRLYASLPCRDVRLGTRVAELRFDQDRAGGVQLQSGEVLPADIVVLATNYHAAQRWVPVELARRDGRFDGLDHLQSSPILGAHLWFDRPVMSQTHAALLNGPLQWVFRKDAQGRAVHGVISAARQWVNQPREQCLRQFVSQLRRAFPGAKRAKLVRDVIVVEKRATFSPLPGVDRYRPGQSPPPRGGVRNLFLAGDYTQTGWPSTMEGAVRSGYLAAESVLDQLKPGGAGPRRFVVEDLTPQWPARLLARR